MDKAVILLLALSVFACPAWAERKTNNAFTVGVNTNLAAYTADLGGAWDESGTDGDLLVNAANDNLTSPVTALTRRARQDTDMGTPDMVVSATVNVTDTSGTENISIFGRQVGTGFNDHYGCSAYDDTAGAGGNIDIDVYKRVASVHTVLATIDFNGTAGTPYQLELRISKNTIECRVNNATSAKAADTDIPTGNFAGVAFAGQDVGTIDNFYAGPHRESKLLP